jgi:hypothetical protein
MVRATHVAFQVRQRRGQLDYLGLDPYRRATEVSSVERETGDDRCDTHGGPGW